MSVCVEVQNMFIFYFVQIWFKVIKPEVFEPIAELLTSSQKLLGAIIDGALNFESGSSKDSLNINGLMEGVSVLSFIKEFRESNIFFGNIKNDFYLKA